MIQEMVMTTHPLLKSTYSTLAVPFSIAGALTSVFGTSVGVSGGGFTTRMTAFEDVKMMRGNVINGSVMERMT